MKSLINDWTGQQIACLSGQKIQDNSFYFAI